ncbi:MAG: TerC family protein [Ignavibacteriae bacterium]|nr:TerC family protein [Ignavibacteriota bacterium]
MNWLTDPQVWIALITLTSLEIVLGIDNIIFISILTGKLPLHQRGRARTIGLALAMLMRIGLLFSITLIMRLTQPLFTVFSNEISGRDIILILGGLFLIAKSTYEIHERLEGTEKLRSDWRREVSFTSVIIQILLLDIVFSLDSVITAVGMTNQLGIMVAAIIIAVIFMMISSGAISTFVHRHPTIKVLALSFLLLIGVTLVAEGLDQHIAKGYIYFAMAFSVFVEMLNLKVGRHEVEPVKLRELYVEETKETRQQ